MNIRPAIATSLILLMVFTHHTAADEPRCPLIPMGAITGRPDEQQVRETLEAYKSVGIDQYLIYARSGLEYEYMGPEWLQMCQWFCQHAQRLNMSIWLYDEYNWPSGSCKGRVPAESRDFESRQFAVYKNADGTFTWDIVHSPGWVDNYDFRAMRRFIELTHKQYERTLGPYLGTTVAGIFTDEPAHPTPVNLTSKPDLLFRYYDGAEADYKAATGRALRDDVQAYLVDSSQDDVWPAYYQLLGHRFRSAYFDQIRTWCDRVGLISTGHMISENSTLGSTQYNGAPLHALKGLTMPGMDEIRTSTTPDSIEWLTLAVAQHAILRNQQGGLAELFALGPSDMSPATHRQMIWLCALHKVNHYLLAVAPLNARGNVEKSGYFNPMTTMQPWFPAFRLLAAESRVAATYASKPMHCNVAIRYPQRDSARLAASQKSHPLLIAALRCFSTQQLTYDLYEEDEPCDKPLVFVLTESGLREERTGETFPSPQEAADSARRTCPDVRVETADGHLAKDVLLRHYQDDSIAVLNLTDHSLPGVQLVWQDGKRHPFELPPRGVFRYEGQRPDSGAPVVTARLSDRTHFEISLSAANTLRLVFDQSKTARIQVDHPVADARLAVLHYPQPCLVTLDGKVLNTDQPCTVLRPGLNQLYRQTEPSKLAAGEHIVTIQSGGGDTNYFLPVAWLTGRFAVIHDRIETIPARAEIGPLWQQGLADFAGQVTYTAQVVVPEGSGTLGLGLNTGGLFAEAALDGTSLGTRAWAPFVWAVPTSVEGRQVELKITVSTSVAPMFGDWQNPSASWNKRFWIPPPKHQSDTGLLSAPEWLLPSPQPRS